jgi:hypothetical protein
MLEAGPGVEVVVGPVAVSSKRELCWSVKALEPGYHRLVFEVGGERFEKELAAGEGLMRVSMKRPRWEWYEMLLHPAEGALRPGSAARWIEVKYERRDTWLSAADWWVAWWFGLSMLAGFCLRGPLGVRM